MPTSSSNTLPVGSTSSEPNLTSTEIFPDICFSKPRRNVTSRAPIAHARKSRLIWTLIFLRRLLMKHHGTETDPSRCICSENPCSIHAYLRPYLMSNEAVEGIRYSSQRMERFLIRKWKSLLPQGQIKSFGHGEGKLSLRKRQ